MKTTKINIAVCLYGLLTIVSNPARADDAVLTLDIDTTTFTWELFARVEDTDGPVTGEFGISAVRALLTDIDFGVDGNAITIATGIGAINPVPTDRGPRPPVLELPDGTIDLIYGQDISDAPSVVVGVGVDGDTLIASGTFSGPELPGFGMDGSLASQALFLSEGQGPFSGTTDPDNTFTIVRVPEPTTLALLSVGVFVFARRRYE